MEIKIFKNEVKVITTAIFITIGLILIIFSIWRIKRRKRIMEYNNDFSLSVFILSIIPYFGSIIGGIAFIIFGLLALV